MSIQYDNDGIKDIAADENEYGGCRIIASVFMEVSIFEEFKFWTSFLAFPSKKTQTREIGMVFLNSRTVSAEKLFVRELNSWGAAEGNETREVWSMEWSGGCT